MAIGITPSTHATRWDDRPTRPFASPKGSVTVVVPVPALARSSQPDWLGRLESVCVVVAHALTIDNGVAVIIGESSAKEAEHVVGVQRMRSPC